MCLKNLNKLLMKWMNNNKKGKNFVRNKDGKIAIIREGEFDLNKQQGKIFNPKFKVKKIC